jgi:Uma2 family endonuclease
MTMVLSQPTQRFVLEDVTWDYYDHTLREIEAAHQHVRVTYDDGRMELMVMGDEHERIKATIRRLLEQYALDMDIPITGLGSVTHRRKHLRKGVEPDECYYVLTPPPPMARTLDLEKYPPPDLAIEVDITSGSIPRQPIYAKLGVPEIWRFDGQNVHPMIRTPKGDYEENGTSRAFPKLPMDQFNHFLQMALETSQHEAVKAMSEWVRGQL